VRALWDGAGEVFSVELAEVEVRAALARRLRGGRLVAARRRFDRYRDDLVVIPVDTVLVEQASEAAERHRLRALDAIHLATAVTVRDRSLVVATWDGELARAARDVGLATAPA
jgi:uncharacterized protein